MQHQKRRVGAGRGEPQHPFEKTAWQRGPCGGGISSCLPIPGLQPRACMRGGGPGEPTKLRSPGRARKLSSPP